MAGPPGGLRGGAAQEEPCWEAGFLSKSLSLTQIVTRTAAPVRDADV